MKTSKAIAKFLDTAQRRDSYWIEHAKLDVSLILERERRRADISYKNMADNLGTSQAYISKVFRGDANLTIETMVKLARSLSCMLDIEIKPQAQETRAFHGADKGLPYMGISSVRAALAELMTEDNGMVIGRFNLPNVLAAEPCNDQAYLDVA